MRNLKRQQFSNLWNSIAFIVLSIPSIVMFFSLKASIDQLLFPSVVGAMAQSTPTLMGVVVPFLLAKAIAIPVACLVCLAVHQIGLSVYDSFAQASIHSTPPGLQRRSAPAPAPASGVGPRRGPVHQSAHGAAVERARQELGGDSRNAQQGTVVQPAPPASRWGRRASAVFPGPARASSGAAASAVRRALGEFRKEADNAHQGTVNPGRSVPGADSLEPRTGARGQAPRPPASAGAQSAARAVRSFLKESHNTGQGKVVERQQAPALEPRSGARRQAPGSAAGAQRAAAARAVRSFQKESQHTGQGRVTGDQSPFPDEAYLGPLRQGFVPRAPSARASATPAPRGGLPDGLEPRSAGGGRPPRR